MAIYPDRFFLIICLTCYHILFFRGFPVLHYSHIYFRCNSYISVPLKKFPKLSIFRLCFPLSVGLSITKSLIMLSPPYFLLEELTVTATVFYSSFVFTINTTVSTFGIIISGLNILRTRINTCFFHPLLFCYV